MSSWRNYCVLSHLQSTGWRTQPSLQNTFNSEKKSKISKAKIKNYLDMPQDTFAVAKIPSPNTPQSEQKNRASGGFIFFSTTLWRSRGIELRFACPAGFCYRKNSIPDPRHNPNKKKPRFRAASFFRNPLASPRGFEPRFLEWKSNVLDRARR